MQEKLQCKDDASIPRFVKQIDEPQFLSTIFVRDFLFGFSFLNIIASSYQTIVQDSPLQRGIFLFSTLTFTIGCTGVLKYSRVLTSVFKNSLAILYCLILMGSAKLAMILLQEDGCEIFGSEIGCQQANYLKYPLLGYLLIELFLAAVVIKQVSRFEKYLNETRNK